MDRFLKKFLRDESGAVTVDWVVICAAVVALAVAIVVAMQAGTVDLGDKVASLMSNWSF